MTNFKNSIDLSILDFDCIVVLGGNFTDKEIFDRFPKATIIAADAGYFNLEQFNIVPHYLVGDLDSVNKEKLAGVDSKTQIHRIEEQDTNDFEKAVNLAESIGKRQILVVGMNGGLLEHTLNNWSVFAKLSRKINLYIFELGRICFSVVDKITLSVNKDELISLVPQPKAIVSSNGLYWEMDKYELAIGGNEGIRNIATQEKVELTIHSGEVLLFINSKF